jgi:hypothetical protein
VDLFLRSKGNNQTRLVVGFSGSSVTAGHDNFFHEAYPAIVERTLQRVFQPLGIEVEVRNHAMGNNPCYPYDTCMSTHLGDDLDIITWEQVCLSYTLCLSLCRSLSLSLCHFPCLSHTLPLSACLCLPVHLSPHDTSP